MTNYLSNKIRFVSFTSIILILYLHSYNIKMNFANESIKVYKGTFSYIIQDFVSDGICRIAVPVFFILSGFLFFINIEHLTKRIYIQKIRKRIKSLLVPFLIWSGIGILLFALLQLAPESNPYFSRHIIEKFSFVDYILGYIGITRQYGRGLDIEKMEESTGEEVMDSGFAEGYIFFTTGLLVGMVPEYFNYIYFDPVIQSITMPVPRALWKGKPSGDYIQIYNRLYGEERYGQGVAVLNFGEYYLAFGWIGVIIGGFLLGFIYKKLWLWYLNFRNNDYAIVLYTVSVSFIFVIISRGYLPQVTMTFFFCVGPAWLIWRNHYIQMRRFLFRKQDDSVSGSAVNN